VPRCARRPSDAWAAFASQPPPPSRSPTRARRARPLLGVDGDRVRWLAAAEPLGEGFRDRVAVLGYRLNRRPGRLAAHLRGCTGPVAGSRVTLTGAGIVHPANVASCGAVTATIIPTPADQGVAGGALRSPGRHVVGGEMLGGLFDLYRLTATTATKPHLPAP
jgi:hypothetical protein